MKKTEHTMEEVAKLCNRFSPKSACRCQNKSGTSDSISCEKCTHYTPDKVCSLDLYKEIMENHDL